MKRLFILFFSFFYIICVFSKSLDLELNAKNAILINPNNNAVLFEKKSCDQIYPASLTKIITIWYVLEKYSNNLNNYLTAGKNALKVIKPEIKLSSNYHLSPYVLESDGSHFDILFDERLTLNDLLHGMLVVSGNDASNVVADNLGGSIDSFMKDLNEFLRAKGFSDTHLKNPHGLHVPDHVSTAYDIAFMTKLALKNSKFRDIFSCKFFVRPKTNKQQKKEIITFNKLLKPGKNYYRYAIGSKTGYHSKAKYNLLSVAKKDNRTLIAIVSGCRDSDSRYEDTIKLFETAFCEKKVKKKILDEKKIFLAKIQGGSKTLKAALSEDLNMEYYPSEERKIIAQILWDDLVAPVKKGQKVATVQLKTKDNEIIKRQNIYALQDVRRSFFFVLSELFKKK